MSYQEIYEWLKRSERRETFLIHLRQPMTLKQLNVFVKKSMHRCRDTAGELIKKDLIYVLNYDGMNNRLYWPTEIGKSFQDRLRDERNLPRLNHQLPRLDWDLYGWTLYRQRSLVLKALVRPMRIHEIVSRVKYHHETWRIGSNNVHAILQEYKGRRLVRKFYQDRNPYPYYGLTRTGRAFQKLLWQAGIAVK